MDASDLQSKIEEAKQAFIEAAKPYMADWFSATVQETKRFLPADYFNTRVDRASPAPDTIAPPSNTQRFRDLQPDLKMLLAKVSDIVEQTLGQDALWLPHDPQPLWRTYLAQPYARGVIEGGAKDKIADSLYGLLVEHVQPLIDVHGFNGSQVIGSCWPLQPTAMPMSVVDTRSEDEKRRQDAWFKTAIETKYCFPWTQAMMDAWSKYAILIRDLASEESASTAQ